MQRQCGGKQPRPRYADSEQSGGRGGEAIRCRQLCRPWAHHQHHDRSSLQHNAPPRRVRERGQQGPGRREQRVRRHDPGADVDSGRPFRQRRLHGHALYGAVHRRRIDRLAALDLQRLQEHATADGDVHFRNVEQRRRLPDDEQPGHYDGGCPGVHRLLGGGAGRRPESELLHRHGCVRLTASSRTSWRCGSSATATCSTARSAARSSASTTAIRRPLPPSSRSTIGCGLLVRMLLTPLVLAIAFPLRALMLGALVTATLLLLLSAAGRRRLAQAWSRPSA